MIGLSSMIYKTNIFKSTENDIKRFEFEINEFMNSEEVDEIIGIQYCTNTKKQRNGDLIILYCMITYSTNEKD
jgi:hypothetical protein